MQPSCANNSIMGTYSESSIEAKALGGKDGRKFVVSTGLVRQTSWSVVEKRRDDDERDRMLEISKMPCD